MITVYLACNFKRNASGGFFFIVYHGCSGLLDIPEFTKISRTYSFLPLDINKKENNIASWMSH